MAGRTLPEGLALKEADMVRTRTPQTAPKVTFSFVPTADPAVVAKIRAELGKPAPKRRAKPAHDATACYQRTLDRTAAHLAADRAEPTATATTVVRVFYTSMGGEILAHDSAPLTARQADTLLASIHGSDAIGAVVLIDGSQRAAHLRTWTERHYMKQIPADWQSIRVVGALDQPAIRLPDAADETPRSIPTPIPTVPTVIATETRTYHAEPRLRGAGRYTLRNSGNGITFRVTFPRLERSAA
jgi:hypothetical protein